METVFCLQPETEFHTDEKCYIIEMLNTPGDETCSIARARVEPGVTTCLHAVRGTVENAMSFLKAKEKWKLMALRL